MPIKVARVVLAAWMLLLAIPAQAAWLKAETPHFRLYSNGGERQLRQFALQIEDYDRLLRLLTAAKGPPSPVKLDIYLVGSAGSLRIVRPKPPPNVLGFYSATPGGIAAVSVRRDGWGIEGQEVLFHEYAHHFMMQYFPYGYPGWYVEGFAEYMMTASFAEKTVEFGGINPGRAYTLLSQPWLPLAKLIEAGPDSLKDRDAGAFYAESWLLVHYLFRTDKTEALNSFLRYRREGQSDAKAFEQAFGMGYAGFERQLRAYMGGRISYTRMTRGSSEAAVPVTVASLPASADDLLLAGLALRLGPDEEAGAALLDRVRQAAGRYPGDRLAAMVLAQAEMAFGDPAVAASLLDPLVAAAPEDAELLYLRGCVELAAGHADDTPRAERFGAAKRWFARAFRSNPDHYQTLYRYAESLSLEPMSENTLNVLLRAQTLAPQVEPIALNAAAGLMRHKRFADAEVLLAPITSNPHSGKLAEHARAMLARAREGREPDLDYAASKETAE